MMQAFFDEFQLAMGTASVSYTHLDVYKRQGYEFEGESRTVDIHVQQVRRKTGLQNRLITIPKLGYRLESQGKR